MLSSVLKSKRAIQVNVQIMRAFVELRGILASNKELAKKLEQLERKYGTHDLQIREIFIALHRLMDPQAITKPPIGFKDI